MAIPQGDGGNLHRKPLKALLALLDLVHGVSPFWSSEASYSYLGHLKHSILRGHKEFSILREHTFLTRYLSSHQGMLELCWWRFVHSIFVASKIAPVESRKTISIPPVTSTLQTYKEGPQIWSTSLHSGLITISLSSIQGFEHYTIRAFYYEQTAKFRV